MSISRHQAVGAYQRWEPDSFDDDHGDGDESSKRGLRKPSGPQPPAPPSSALNLEDAPEGESAQAEASTQSSAENCTPADAAEDDFDGELPADFKLPTAADIERMHDDIRAAAMEEGRREGQAEGHSAGHEQGYAEGKALAEEEATRLVALAEQLEQALTGIDHEVAEELMALAIELARQMVRETLAQHPESILDTIRLALQQLPQGHAHIHLHPDDLALVRKHSGEQLSHSGHRLQEDANLMRGDCRVDAGGAQVDATLETRWRRVLESLGREHAHYSVSDEAVNADKRANVEQSRTPRARAATAADANAATDKSSVRSPTASAEATSAEALASSTPGIETADRSTAAEVNEDADEDVDAAEGEDQA